MGRGKNDGIMLVVDGGDKKRCDCTAWEEMSLIVATRRSANLTDRFSAPLKQRSSM